MTSASLRSRDTRVAIMVGAAAALAATIPLWMPSAMVLVLTLILLTVAGALPLNLVSGTAGLLSLGYLAFLLCGAFVAGYLIDLQGWFWLPAVLAGATVTAILGFVIALPSLRWRGIYVVLGTFGLNFVVLYIANALGRNLGRANGFSFGSLDLGPFHAGSTTSWYYVMLALGALSLYVVYALGDPPWSRFARSWIAARENRIVADAIGIDVPRYNVIAFMVSSFMIGLVGGVYGLFVGTLTYEPLSAAMSLEFLAILLVGGIGSIGGAVIGGAFFVGTPYAVRWVIDALPREIGSVLAPSSAGLELLTFGVAVIVVMSIEPRGLIELIRRGGRRASARRILPRSLAEAPIPERVGSRMLPASVTKRTGAGQSPDGAAALEARGIVVDYGPVRAVSDVDVQVPRGSVVGVIGLNGAGKTSLLRALSGFTPAETGRVPQGTVFLDGQDVSRLGPAGRTRQGLVLVPEREKIFKTLTVDENLSAAVAGPAERSLSKDAIYELFPALMRRRELPAGFLSGGERQMLSLARALYQGPTVLLIDEMSLGLAPVVVKDLVAAVRHLRREAALSILLVEQNPAILLDLADIVLVIRQGRVVDSGPPAHTLEASRLERTFLGHGRK